MHIYLNHFAIQRNINLYIINKLYFNKKINIASTPPQFQLNT